MAKQRKPAEVEDEATGGEPESAGSDCHSARMSAQPHILRWRQAAEDLARWFLPDPLALELGPAGEKCPTGSRRAPGLCTSAGLLSVSLRRPVTRGELHFLFDTNRPAHPEGSIGKFSLLTLTSKMGCYSFNLPAGPPAWFGACPASAIGWAIEVEGVRPDRAAQRSVTAGARAAAAPAVPGLAAGAASACVQCGEKASSVAQFVCRAYCPPSKLGGQVKGESGQWAGGCCPRALGPNYQSDSADRRAPQGHGCRACWLHGTSSAGRKALSVAYREH